MPAAKLNLPLWKAEALSYLGVVYYELDNYSKALQLLNEAQEIAADRASEKIGIIQSY